MRKRKIIKGIGFASGSNYGAPVWWLRIEDEYTLTNKTIPCRRGQPFYPGVHEGWCSPWVYCKAKPYWKGK